MPCLTNQKNHRLIVIWPNRCGSYISFLVNEPMKPRWMVFCGKVAVSNQFKSHITHINTGYLANRTTQPFLDRPEIILLSFCGQCLITRACLYYHSRGSVLEPQLVSGNNFTTSCIRMNKQGRNKRRKQWEDGTGRCVIIVREEERKRSWRRKTVL